MQNKQNFQVVLDLSSGSWKQKIAFLDQLTEQITTKQLLYSPTIIQNLWPYLIRENNINVLERTVSTLKLWVQNFKIRSIKVQTDLIRSLILLSKMGRSEIDLSVTSIVLNLIQHQKHQNNTEGRAPLGILTHNQFNKSNNPTFYIGLQQLDTIQEEKNKKSKEKVERNVPLSKSCLLDEVIASMKSCHKNSFVLCLRIINSLIREKLLAQGQLNDIMKQVNQVHSVIEHRKVAPSVCKEREKKTDERMNELLGQLEYLSV